MHYIWGRIFCTAASVLSTSTAESNLLLNFWFILSNTSKHCLFVCSFLNFFFFFTHFGVDSALALYLPSLSPFSIVLLLPLRVILNIHPFVHQDFQLTTSGQGYGGNRPVKQPKHPFPQQLPPAPSVGSPSSHIFPKPIICLTLCTFMHVWKEKKKPWILTSVNYILI